MLGKFGQFDVNELIGKIYEVPYEIYDGKKLRRALLNSVLETMEIENSEGNNNSKIFDDKSSQKLSHEDIEALKQGSLKGEVSSQSIIKTIVTNSTTFDLKTEFAKAKYIKRKEQKFSKSFRVYKPTSRLMIELYSSKKGSKIRDIRIDTLSQMMCLANVRAGSKVLVVDDCSGIILASVLERMGGYGSILFIHPSESPSFPLLTEMSLPQSQIECIQTLAWNRLEENIDEKPEFHRADRTEEKIQRTNERIQKIRESREILLDGGFEALIVASQYDPLEVTKTLLPYLTGCCPIVVYSNNKESLLSSFIHMRGSPEFVNAQLTESWTREYQIPVHVTGTHPHMMTSGSGGYLLNAIRVFESSENIERFTS
ncbi:tRNA (adenine(58)-N(1))-methyltransferase non-catalytic subunit trm6, partial [Nowakowskiella sp. JEL0078]